MLPPAIVSGSTGTSNEDSQIDNAWEFFLSRRDGGLVTGNRETSHNLSCCVSLTVAGKGRLLASVLDQLGPIRPAPMQITRAADYAVRVMVHLASLPPGTTLRRPEIAEATEVPESFLSKVLQQLVQAGMISSQRGSGGGFRLVAESRNLSLLDVLEAIEGPTRLNACLEPGASCGRKGWCAAHVVWSEAQAALVHVLRSISIARLASRSSEAQAVGGRDKARDEIKTIDLYGIEGQA